MVEVAEGTWGSWQHPAVVSRERGERSSSETLFVSEAGGEQRPCARRGRCL